MSASSQQKLKTKLDFCEKNAFLKPEKKSVCWKFSYVLWVQIKVNF